MRDGKGKTIVGIVLAILIGLVVWSMVSTQARWKHSDLGLAEYKKGNYRKATEYYTKAIEAHPNEAFLYNNRGLAYYGLERYDEAISDYNKAIELKPDYAEAYLNRGLAYFKKGSYYKTEPYQKAISDFTKAIELKPDFVDAYYNRGMTYIKYVHYHHKYKTIPPEFPPQDVEYYKKALADFDKVLELDPSYVLAHEGRGNLFYRHGDWDLATEEYNKALERKDEILKKVGEEGLAGVYNSRGRNLLAAGKLEEAISDFTKAIEYYRKGAKKGVGLSKNITNALAHRTVAAWELGRWEDAIKYADECIEVKESDPERFGDATSYYYFTKGRCYYKLGRYDEAVANLKKALGEPKYGMDARARLWLDRVYKAKGDEKKAREEIKKALKYYDEGVKRNDEYKIHKAAFRRGICYLELGEYEKAISDFEETIKRKALSDRPVNHTNYYLDAHKYIGIAYMRAGKEDKAREYFRKTIELAKERGFKEVVEEVEELLSEL